MKATCQCGRPSIPFPHYPRSLRARLIMVLGAFLMAGSRSFLRAPSPRVTETLPHLHSRL